MFVCVEQHTWGNCAFRLFRVSSSQCCQMTAAVIFRKLLFFAPSVRLTLGPLRSALAFPTKLSLHPDPRPHTAGCKDNFRSKSSEDLATLRVTPTRLGLCVFVAIQGNFRTILAPNDTSLAKIDDSSILHSKRQGNLKFHSPLPLPFHTHTHIYSSI
jgi:hypothetical protein